MPRTWRATSAPYRCVRHPAAISNCPARLARARSRRTSSDSSLAGPMKPQVLTTNTSAFSGEPASASGGGRGPRGGRGSRGGAVKWGLGRHATRRRSRRDRPGSRPQPGDDLAEPAERALVFAVVENMQRGPVARRQLDYLLAEVLEEFSGQNPSGEGFGTIDHDAHPGAAFNQNADVHRPRRP